MLQSSHPPTPLSRPRPPSRRQSSSGTTVLGGGGGANAPPTNRLRTSVLSHEPAPIDETDERLPLHSRRTREPTPELENPHRSGPLGALVMDDQPMKDSPLSAAARLLQRRVPGFTVDSSGVANLHDAFLGPQDPSSDPISSSSLKEGEEALGRDRAGSVHSQKSNASATAAAHQALSQEWVQSKTRDELEDLLLQADRVIRERERDLSIAASIGKSLLENNVALRARQVDSSSVPATAAARLTPRKPFASGGRSNRCELIEGLPPPSPLKFAAASSKTSTTTSRRSSLVGGSETASVLVSPSASLRSSPSSPRHHRSVGNVFNDGSPTKPRWSPGHRASRSDATSAASSEPSRPTPYRHAHHNSIASFSPLVDVASSSSSSTQSSRRGSLTKKRAPRQPASSLAAQQALVRLEQQNSELADQLASLESEAAEGEEAGRKRLSRVVKELEGVRRKLRDAEARNGELEKEKEDLLVEGQAQTKRLYQGRALRKLEGLGEEDEEDGDVLGKKAEEIGERMRRVLKKMSEGTLEDDDDDEFDLDDAVAAETDGLAEREERDRLDERSFSERYGTTVDSGPTTPRTPTLDVLLDAAEHQNEGSHLEVRRDEHRESYLSIGSTNTAVSDSTATTTPPKPLRSSFRSSLSSLTHPSAAPIQQPSAQESALIAALLMQIAELQNSQMGFDYERAELLGKLERAREEVEDLKREIDEMDEEYGYDDEGDEDERLDGWDDKMVGWQERKGLIGWRPDSEGGQQVESRRRHRFSAPVGFGRSGRDETFRAPVASAVPRRSLHSEMGSQWAGSQHDEAEAEAWETDRTEDDDVPGSLRPPRPRRRPSPGATPSKRRQRRQAQISRTYEEIERMAQELPVEWADDVDESSSPRRRGFRGRRSPQKANLAWSFEAEADDANDQLDPDQAGLWNDPADRTVGIESREAVEQRWAVEAAERKRIGRLMLEKRRREMDDGLSVLASSSIGDGSTARAGTSSATPTEYTGELRHRKSQMLHRLGLDSDEEEDWEGQDDESWDFIDAFDHENRRPGERGTDYYPVSLRARHHPRMVVQRLHDRWMRWFLLLAQWVQLFVVITLAVGWAISKGPKAILEGRKGFDRRGGQQPAARQKRIM